VIYIHIITEYANHITLPIVCTPYIYAWGNDFCLTVICICEIINIV